MVGVACGASPVPYTSIAQLIGPMHRDLGWAIGDISLGITLFGFSTTLSAVGSFRMLLTNDNRGKARREPQRASYGKRLRRARRGDRDGESND
jgi:hypothetical protein